jgi:hypothetical protein
MESADGGPAVLTISVPLLQTHPPVPLTQAKLASRTCRAPASPQVAHGLDDKEEAQLTRMARAQPPTVGIPGL